MVWKCVSFQVTMSVWCLDGEQLKHLVDRAPLFLRSFYGSVATLCCPPLQPLLIISNKTHGSNNHDCCSFVPIVRCLQRFGVVEWAFKSYFLQFTSLRKLNDDQPYRPSLSDVSVGPYVVGFTKKVLPTLSTLSPWTVGVGSLTASQRATGVQNTMLNIHSCKTVLSCWTAAVF